MLNSKRLKNFQACAQYTFTSSCCLCFSIRPQYYQSQSKEATSPWRAFLGTFFYLSYNIYTEASSCLGSVMASIPTCHSNCRGSNRRCYLFFFVFFQIFPETCIFLLGGGRGFTNVFRRFCDLITWLYPLFRKVKVMCSQWFVFFPLQASVRTSSKFVRKMALIRGKSQRQCGVYSLKDWTYLSNSFTIY